MAEGKNSDAKSGPVKPPVLEGKARDATRAQSAKVDPTKASPAGAESPKPEIGPGMNKPEEPKGDKGREAAQVPPKTGAAETAKPASLPPPPPIAPASQRQPKPNPLWPALGGGLIGLAAAYGLAWAGFWPAQPVPPPAEDPRIAAIAAEIPELRTVGETTQSELAALNQRIGSLEAAVSEQPEPGEAPAAAAAPVDLSAIETDIAALSARIDAIPEPAPADPGQAEAIAQVQAELRAFNSRIDELAARLGTAEASVTALNSSVAANAAALDAQPSDIGAVLQLPLILSGFEAAFMSGRPFEAELAALRSALPDAIIPTGIANAATSGLARADAIAGRFTQLLPAILAGRPADPQASWQDGTLDWFRSMIALRPTEEVEGNEPEAIISRLEAAIGRRDFAAAQALFADLPAPMRAAAEEVPANVALQAEAARFLQELRQRALSDVGEASP